MYEGKGNVPPKPELILIDDTVMRCIIDSCQPLDRYAPRTDVWGGGLLGSATLPRLTQLSKTMRPVVAGKCGEYAVRELAVRRIPNGEALCPPIDFVRRSKGDGGRDLLIGRTPVQIKARVTGSKNLVRAIDEHGNALPLEGRVHIFGAWCLDYWMHVLGWLPNQEITAMPVENSPIGKWKNYVISDAALLPMSRLWGAIEWRAAS